MAESINEKEIIAKNKVHLMLKQYNISEKLELSIQYYFASKIRVLEFQNKCNYMMIEILNSWIESFEYNVKYIIDENDIEYTWVGYNDIKKELMIGMGKQVNINKNAVSTFSSNLKTSQYIYKLFGVLDRVTNIKIENESDLMYELLCNNIAKVYVGAVPKIDKYKICPKEDVFMNVASYENKVDIVYNYLDIINNILMQKNEILCFMYTGNYLKIKEIFNIRYNNIIFHDKVINDVYETIRKYILDIYAENEYYNYIKYNKELSEMLLLCLKRKHSVNNKIDTTNVYYIAEKKDALEKMCYRMIKERKIVIADEL